MPRLLPALAVAGGLILGATAAVPAAVAAPAAMADAMAMPGMHMPPPPDRIVLQLHAEGWVETKTARVTVVVERALRGDEAAKEQNRTPAVLADLAKGADWHVTGFDRTRDPTGLEHWRITAEARLQESQLGGIYDRAQGLSQPGRQVQVADVDFSPTVAEREATAAALRAEIYRRAEAEAKQAGQTWPDRGFRVHRVDFTSGPRPVPYAKAQMMRAMAPAPAAAEAGGGTTLTERMELTASVVLAAPGK